MATKLDIARIVKHAEKIEKRKAEHRAENGQPLPSAESDYALEALQEIYGRRTTKEALQKYENEVEKDETAVEKCLELVQKKQELEERLQWEEREKYVPFDAPIAAGLMGGGAAYFGIVLGVQRGIENGNMWGGGAMGLIIGGGLGFIAGMFSYEGVFKPLGERKFNRKKNKNKEQRGEELSELSKSMEKYHAQASPGDFILYAEQSEHRSDSCKYASPAIVMGYVESVSAQGITAAIRYQKKTENEVCEVQQKTYLNLEKILGVVAPHTEALSTEELLQLKPVTPLLCMQEGKVISYGFLKEITRDLMTLSVDTTSHLQQGQHTLQEIEEGKVQVYQLLMKREEKKKVKRSI